MNAILLAGYLTRNRLREVRREIERYETLRWPEKMRLVLVISSEGGDASETVELIQRIEKAGTHTSAKIYRAESAAALIAMAASEREIVRGGIFTLGLGSAEIDSGTLITPEKVPKRIIEEAKRLRATTFHYMKRCGFPESGPLMNTLLAQNWLTLTAEKCLRLGIVERII